MTFTVALQPQGGQVNHFRGQTPFFLLANDPNTKLPLPQNRQRESALLFFQSCMNLPEENVAAFDNRQHKITKYLLICLSVIDVSSSCV